MDMQILQELVVIRWIVIGILVVFVLVLAAATVFATSMMRLTRSRVAADLRTDFRSEVEQLEDCGRYDAMASLCEERLREFPADVWARFKLAVARNKAGKPGLALDALARVKALDPAWEREYIDGYIEQIRSSMKGPKK